MNSIIENYLLPTEGDIKQIDQYGIFKTCVNSIDKITKMIDNGESENLILKEFFSLRSILSLSNTITNKFYEKGEEISVSYLDAYITDVLKEIYKTEKKDNDMEMD